MSDSSNSLEVMALTSGKAQWLARRAIQALSHSHPRPQLRATCFRRLSYPATRRRFSPLLSPHGHSGTSGSGSASPHVFWPIL